jgi:hypothetical protein
MNNYMRTLNSKLQKYVKTFNHALFLGIDYNRKFFTSHGQHLNALGKELLANQIVQHIQTVFEEKVLPPTFLDRKTEKKRH